MTAKDHAHGARTMLNASLMQRMDSAAMNGSCGSANREPSRKAVKMMPRGRPKGNYNIVYSVWRNNDDQLLILDKPAKECSKILGITEQSFRRIAGSSDKNGYGNAYTIRKARIEQVKREEES